MSSDKSYPLIEAAKKFYDRYLTYVNVTPILVASVLIVGSFVIAGLLSRSTQTAKIQAIDKQLKENRLLIESSFNSYAQIVWSGVGRLNSGPVDRVAWRKFVGTYDLEKKYPAISSMAVTRVLKPEEQAGFTERLSQEYGLPIQISSGDPNQTINVSEYAYPERPTTPDNMGFNVSSTPERQHALQAATDSGDIAMTDQLQLVTNAREKTTSDQAAFLIYAPYYKQDMPLDTVEQRQAAIAGHVSASFRTNNVFQKIFENTDLSRQTVAITMGAGDRSYDVYQNHTKLSGVRSIERSQELQIFGQTFKMNYTYDSDYLVTATQLRAPLYVVAFGSLMGVLAGTITYFFLRGRYHQLLLDKERDITRAKDELLSLASHQLRTPATGVKQYLGMVLQGFSGDVDPAQRKLLDKAYKSNERQLHVINDILHLAKLDLGRIVLAKTEFDLADLVRDVLDEQRQDLKAGKLKLKTKLPKAAPIHADKHMLRMVVENVISNAIKYTDPGGVISIALKREGDGYVVSVKDTGVGIAAEDQSKLFKQFSRVMNPRSHLVTGTGVGLYLSRHLMQLHQGDISVDSTPGEGSLFSVYVPNIDERL